ncbi:MAG: winged helix-turn-helix transcriptional regulator [Anaerolineales bacterium]|nr:winged helix-turn-helix transcriptional regulator [Anaerolineales bacterium]
MKPNLPPEIPELAERQAALCKIFANPQRILILWLLAERERTVTEVALTIGVSLQSASQHLRIMEFGNLVEHRREHHNIYYHLVDNELLKDCRVFKKRPKDQHLEVALI